jgi:hypothetical protein
MRRLRRLIIVVALIVLAVSVLLLLNVTAPNPTGRRYSSEPVLTTGRSQDIGLSAEMILSGDLGVPRNDAPDQRQCICGNSQNGSVPNDCRSCILYSPVIANHRRPDFVTSGYIAEAKNRQNLLYTYTDQVEQITEYAQAARALNVPLWLFTRTETNLSPEYYHIVEATGGGVVPYFTIPGYVDPVDKVAQFGLIGSLSAIMVIVLLDAISRLPRKAPSPPKSPTGKAVRTTQDAEDFLNSTRGRLRSQIDIEDSRDEF